MRIYIKKILIYLLVISVSIGMGESLTNVSAQTVGYDSGDEFNGDVTENPWKDFFDTGTKDPDDLVLDNAGEANNGSEDKGSQSSQTSTTVQNGNDTATADSSSGTTLKIAKTKVRSATKAKKNAKKARIVLKKIKNATGYQIKYSTSKSFKKSKTKTKTYKKNKFTIKKLKPGRKYYVKARAFAKVNGKKVYGAWSKKKAVKVK